ncbi:MAG: HEPN domain-containing protein [Bacteroidota bacterium]
MSDSKEERSKFRLSKAKEALKKAQILAKTNTWNHVAKWLYYSCFHIAVSYLILDGRERGTHKRLKTKFNQLLVLEGKIDAQYGKLYNRLFELRQDVDFKDFDEERIAPLIDQVSKFIDLIEQLMNEE